MVRDPSSVRSGTIPGSRRVGRKPAFDAADVISAAIAEGVDRFTLSAVAERLGVATTAIYRIFPSRDALVIACLDAAGATLARPQPDMPWRETLRLWADECWRVCEEYPGLSRLVYSYPLAPTRITAVFSAYADDLTAQGRTHRQAMFAIGLLADTVFASRWSVEAMQTVNEKGTRGLDVVRDAVGNAGTPLRPAESWIKRDSTDTKVEFILTGLERNWPES